MTDKELNSRTASSNHKVGIMAASNQLPNSSIAFAHSSMADSSWSFANS